MKQNRTLFVSVTGNSACLRPREYSLQNLNSWRIGEQIVIHFRVSNCHFFSDVNGPAAYLCEEYCAHTADSECPTP